MKRGRACGHCGSPSRGNPCWFGITVAKRWKGSGGDAPCWGDVYEDRACEDERDTFRKICIILIVLVMLFLAMVYGALAHSWYDPQCCSDTDCRPVHADEVIETEKGWKHLPSGVEFTRDMVKPSRDHRFHVCIGNKPHDRGRPYCIYVLQGV